MNRNTQSALAVTATLALSAGTILAGLATEVTGDRAFDAAKRPVPTTALAPQAAVRVTEDAAGFDCRHDGNRVCGTPRLRALVRKLATRPALILPGQWETPNGTALVLECFASYPGNGIDGRPGPELIACLQQPDPRATDRRVMTLHQHHINHVNHKTR